MRLLVCLCMRVSLYVCLCLSQSLKTVVERQRPWQLHFHKVDVNFKGVVLLDVYHSKCVWLPAGESEHGDGERVDPDLASGMLQILLKISQFIFTLGRTNDAVGIGITCNHMQHDDVPWVGFNW